MYLMKNFDYYILIKWKEKKTIHCIDNNERIYTNEIKAQFYKKKTVTGFGHRSRVHRFDDLILSRVSGTKKSYS
jgi:hypothetical protein